MKMETFQITSRIMPLRKYEHELRLHLSIKYYISVFLRIRLLSVSRQATLFTDKKTPGSKNRNDPRREISRSKNPADRIFAKCRGYDPRSEWPVSWICLLYGSFASSLIFNLCRAAARTGMKYSASYLTGHPYVRSILNDRSWIKQIVTFKLPWPIGSRAINFHKLIFIKPLLKQAPSFATKWLILAWSSLLVLTNNYYNVTHVLLFIQIYVYTAIL